jgi:predicted GIY-YIG superfamily endonuclease
MSWISDKIAQIQSVFASYTQGTNKKAANFGDLKVSELKAIAKEKGLKGYTNLRKAELIEMLNQN